MILPESVSATQQKTGSTFWAFWSYSGRISLQVRILWTSLSIMVSAGCTYSFTQPIWFINGSTKDSLGLYNYCVRDLRTRSAALHQLKIDSPGLQDPSDGTVAAIAALSQVCGVYGGQFHLSNLPSNVWQIACVLFGGGCFLLCVGSIASTVSISLPSRLWSTRMACYTGYIQSIAAVILIGGVAIFPLGLDSKFVQHYCPGSRIYNSGSCHVGWAYMLGVMSTALSIFCPFLSHYTDICDDLYIGTPLIT